MTNSSNKKITIQTKEAPQAIGPYSQATQLGDTLYISGQIPLTKDNEDHLLKESIEVQTHQVFKNLSAITKAANTTLNHCLKLNIFLSDLEDFSIVNNIMVDYFTAPFPARATLQVARLPLDAKIEIDGIFHIPK